MCTLFKLYLRTPSDLESRMTSDKIMRFMSTPPIRASLNLYRIKYTIPPAPCQGVISLLRQNAGLFVPAPAPSLRYAAVLRAPDI